MYRPFAVLMLALAACGTELSVSDADDRANDDPSRDTDVVDTDAPAADWSGEDCTAQVAWIDPAHDARHVSPDATVSVGFTGPLPGDVDAWEVSVAGVPADVLVDNTRNTVTLAPRRALSRSTRHDVVVEVCGEQAIRSFTTLDAPVTFAELTDRTWSVPLGAADWLAPTAARVFAPFLEDLHVIVQVVPGPEGHHLFATLGEVDGADVTWDACQQPADLGGVVMGENPRFVASTDALSMTIADTSVSLSELSVSGVFAGGGASLEQIVFDGSLDVRAIEALTGASGLCFIAAGLGEPCSPCLDGAVQCLPALATTASAEELAVDADLDVACPE